MTTRADLRARLRTELEDSAGASHSWADAELDTALRYAMRSYGTANPIELSTTLNVNSAIATYTLPAAISDPRQLVHVLDDSGRALEPDPEPQPTLANAPLSGLVARTWRVWGTQLTFNQRPPATAVYTLLYRAPRSLIEDDVTAQPIPSVDEPILVAMAASSALIARAISEDKRGYTKNAASLRATAKALADDAELKASQGNRAARGRVLG